jgi:hypothetical protein
MIGNIDFNQVDSNLGSGNGKNGKQHEARIFRHGKAKYQLDYGIIESETPEAKPEAKNQWFDSDLTPEGAILAKQEAEKYFDSLNPETDALFFVSSDLVRAAETAKIFLDIAREQGFEIIKPRDPEVAPQSVKYRNKAEEIGEGDIRKINCLTLDHLENMLQEAIFNPNDFLKEVVRHPEKISEETRNNWIKARAIIDSDNKGSWGDNFYAHSDAIAKIFPDVKSARETYEKKFISIIKLLEFANRKTREQQPRKNIKILGFSHENSFIYFLNKIYGESLKNYESVGFRMVEQEEGTRQILIEAKGVQKKFEKME